MGKLAQYLNRYVVGNVFDRSSIVEAYSTDRSPFKITPRLVAIPETTSDIRKILRFANQLATQGHSLPVTVRGAGRGKTGAALGPGLVISTEHLNHIEEIDVRGRLVRVQPGVTLGRLNAALALLGLYLPVGWDDRATIGGLIAESPNDDWSNCCGGISTYLERAEVVLANGDLAQFAAYNIRAVNQKLAQTSFEGALYRRVEEILETHADAILDRSTRPFDLAGYASITKVRQSRSLSLLPLLLASQGTLGVITDVILRVEVLPAQARQLMLILRDANSLPRLLDRITELEPRDLKLYDLRIIEAAANYGNKPDFFMGQIGQGFLALVSFVGSKRAIAKKFQHCLEILPAGTTVVEETAENSTAFREFQTALSSFLNDVPLNERAPILDDVYVPSYKLTEFLAGLKELEEILDLELSLFGSFATSNYQIRPDLGCTGVDDRKQLVEFLQHYSRLIINNEGSLTGGTPEGRLKVLPAVPELPDREQQLYQDIKEAFDPNGVLNPEVKTGATFANLVKSLRKTPQSGVIS